jgi:hypothetical protein
MGREGRNHAARGGDERRRGTQAVQAEGGIAMRWLIGLVGTGVVVFVTFLTLALATSSSVPSSGGFPHSLLEADRVMTERMGTDVGAGMQYQMESYGMLERSADPRYLRALEAHTLQFDRMLGRAP